MIINAILTTIGILMFFIVSIFSIFVFSTQTNPMIKIIISSFLFLNLIIISIIFTLTSKYNFSYLIDIIVIYFILGFASLLLYFMFFNKRS
jgi:hypothetical protein